MMKKMVVILLLCSAALMLFVACSGTGALGGTTGNTSTSGSSNEVHMSAQTFVQPSITISKGSSIMLVDDVSVLHILANGSWQNGVAKPANEPGAPTVKNVQVNGNNVEIGPFATAGTYHLYCTIHPGMNLTVIVQ